MRVVLTAAIAVAFALALSTAARATTITVNSLADTGAPGICVLRDAITAANTMSATNGCAAGSGIDSIKFGVVGTISVASVLPAIVGNLAILGPSTAPRITISGNGGPIMTVNAGARLTLRFLTLVQGRNAISSSGTLTVANSTFTNNVATEGCVLIFCGGNAKGGAIRSSGTAIISNSTFQGNTAKICDDGLCAGGEGGAIFNSGTLSVTNSTFNNNSTFSGGIRFGEGGAIFNSGATAALITNSTFSGNTAVDGAAVFGPSKIKGSILAASTGGGGNCSIHISPPTDEGYNISNDNTCGFDRTGSADNGDNVNPLLSSAGLANNGGPTQTIALRADSPAINAIPIADCTDQSSPPKRIATDQRGFPRPDAGEAKCDIGAYESTF
jgi:hypothetical protein